MADGERVVVVVGEAKVVDVQVVPGTAPFFLFVLATCYPDATLYLEGEPQDRANLQATLMEALAGHEQAPPTPSAVQGAGAPPGLPTLATADLVMQSLAQFQAETFASIMRANEGHLSRMLLRDALFARQMFAHRESLRKSLAQLDIVDRAMKMAEVNANLRMHDAATRGGPPPEGRKSPVEGVTFGDILTGLDQVGTTPNQKPN